MRIYEFMNSLTTYEIKETNPYFLFYKAYEEINYIFDRYESKNLELFYSLVEATFKQYLKTHICLYCLENPCKNYIDLNIDYSEHVRIIMNKIKQECQPKEFIIG